MFSNQISTKDLFGYPMRHNGPGRDSNDSANCSQGNSQFLNSQVECSQLSFQDSQLESQSQTDSDGRRMYQKYVSKGSLFNTDGGFSSNNITSQGKISHQQFIQSQKAKAKERDERDLLRSIMSIVNDSTSEVRQALQSFSDSIESKHGNSEENISSSFKKLSEEVKKSCEKVVESVTKRDDLKEEIHHLEKEIAKRDAVISGLEKQVKEYQQKDEQKMIDMLKECHMQQIETLEGKLQKLLNVTSEQLKLYDKQVTWHNEQESDQKDFQEVQFKEQLIYLKRLEEKLMAEMSNLQLDFENKQVQLGNYYKQQFQESHHRNAATMESCVQKTLVEGLRQASRDTCSWFNQQKQDIDKTCSRNKQELEEFLKKQLAQQLADYDQKICQVVDSIKSAVPKEEERMAIPKPPASKTGSSCYSNGMWVTLPLRSPKSISHNEAESGTNEGSYRCDFETITIKSPEYHVTSSYTRSTIPHSGAKLFTSPWNAKTLFARSHNVNPSPVAKVSPMVQNKVLETKNVLMPMDSPKESPQVIMAKQRGKKQKGIVQPQRRSQRLSTNYNGQKKPNRENFQPEMPKTITQNYSDYSGFQEIGKGKPYNADQGSIYDEDQVSILNNNCTDLQLKRKSRPWTDAEPDWLKVARCQHSQKRSGSDSSRQSSPSLSMMEVVVKRRVKCDRTQKISPKYSQQTTWSNVGKKTEVRDKRAFGDLLSTPCFRSYDGLTESSQDQAPVVWEGKISRKATGKRTLCDMNYDTQITEITQSIRRHLQRVKPN